MRKPPLCARALSVLLACALGFSPLSAAAAVVEAPRLIPSAMPAASAGAAALAPSASPLSAVPFAPAPALVPAFAAAPVLAAAPVPAAAVAAAPALSAAAAQSAAMTAPEVPADGAKAEAGRSFDLTAARPAPEAGSVLAAPSVAAAALAPSSPLSAALKAVPPLPNAAPRWRSRAKAYAPKLLFAAAATAAVWILHHLGVSPAMSAAPLAFLAGTLGEAAWTPSPAILTDFMARAAQAAPAGTVLSYDHAGTIGGKLGLDGEQVQLTISELMRRGDLGMRDNKILVHYDFAARASHAADPKMTEDQGDLAAADAVKLLNSGAPLDHARGLDLAAKALGLYDRSEHETGKKLEQRKQAETLHANLVLEHLADLLRLHKAAVEANRPAGDAFRTQRVADADEALDWLKTANFSRGHIPTISRELDAKILEILKDITPRDEQGGQPEYLVNAYIEIVDLFEKYDPFYFLDRPEQVAALSKEEQVARDFRDGILEETKPGTPLMATTITAVSDKLSLDTARAKLQLTAMARDGWIVIMDNGTMIRASVAGRLAAAAPGDPARSAHELAVAGVKLLNSADALDHLRAVARLQQAGEAYARLGKAQPDHMNEEISVLRANAVLEAAGDALRRLPQEAPGVKEALTWLSGAYYSADRRSDMPHETAELLHELLDLRAFRPIVKDRINGDLEIVRGVRLTREFLARNMEGGKTLPGIPASDEVDMPETAGGFRPLKRSEYGTLLEYGTDITKKASDGGMRPMIGRKAEIRQMIKTLLRVEKNNPLVIGEKGVGKTAIVNGLAQLVASGEIPELRGKNIVKIDLTKVVAGTRYRGQFEERMQAIIDEAKKSNGRIILFIDEIHMIVGLGDSDKATDAAQILKESLADGSLSVIGATTMDEFRKIEKDGALMRRFNPVKLLPPTKEEAEAIVEGVKPIYEKKHGVTIAIETVRAAVALAMRYVTDRHLPDSALDLMDDASAEVELKASEAIQAGKENPTKSVTAEDIAQEISMRTGIPAGKLNEDKKIALKRLPADMKTQVIGQDEAVEAVAEAVQAGETGYRDPKQPIASFVFLGPTGVGKTELARALAKIKFGSEKNMLRLDMSEYMEKHSVSRLVSAPPGYVGHDEGGQLTEPIRRNPYQVILLDEIEKAHPDVFDVLLQVLEDGRLTDSQGRTVDFSNTIIIMTSNIGGSVSGDAKDDAKKFDDGWRDGKDGFEYKQEGFGFNGKVLKRAKGGTGNTPERRKHYLDAFKEKYRPEFVNRVGEDRVIVFNEIAEKGKLGLILDLRLKALEHQLKDKNLKVSLTDAAREAVLTKALAQSQYGARPVKQIVDREINRALKDAELEGRIADGDAVLVDWDAAAGRYRAGKAP